MPLSFFKNVPVLRTRTFLQDLREYSLTVFKEITFFFLKKEDALLNGLVQLWSFCYKHKGILQSPKTL